MTSDAYFDLKAHWQFRVTHIGIWIFLLLICFLSVARGDEEALVITDGAMVYKDPDFDASVIGYLPVGEKVRVATKRFGPFFRFKFKQGIFGYISDVDVKRTSGGGGENTESPPGQQGNPQPARKNIFATKLLGFSGGYAEFREVINRQEVKDGIPFYGLKATLPVSWFQGPFWFDLDLVYHSGAPKYYSSVSTLPPTGHVVFFDPTILFHFFDFWGRGGWTYLGGGPHLSYTRILVEVNSSKQDLEELRLGGVVLMGFSFGLSRSLFFKVEPRYYLEKANYWGVNGSLQFSL